MCVSSRFLPVIANIEEKHTISLLIRTNVKKEEALKEFELTRNYLHDCVLTFRDGILVEKRNDPCCFELMHLLGYMDFYV